MSKDQNLGLSEEVKAKLLAKMRQNSQNQGLNNSGNLGRKIENQFSKDLTSFETLPSYTQLRVQQAVAKKLGLIEPYYVCHDGLSQATAQIEGKTYLNFSCYDYLGLNGDSRIAEAINLAVAKYGSSASASRLTAGERPPHRALEQAIAKAYGTEDCLVFVSGHATNVSTILCLFGSQDVIFYDARSHNSLVLGALASGSARFSFPNNDLEVLRSLLQEHRHSFKRALIVTEGLFGMDGCLCDLKSLIELKNEFGCFLMVDEAHSFGVVGKTGLGVHEHFGIEAKNVDIWMGTLSKSFCGCGGFICGSKVLIEILKFQAPGFVYSVGMPPMLASASLKALEIMLAEPYRVSKLQHNCQFMLKEAKAAGLDTGKAEGYAVIPIMLGSSLTCVIAAQLLREAGILVLPIIYPGVEEGQARLRFFISQTHSEEQMVLAVQKLAELIPQAKARAAEFSGLSV